jgi:hypothetical protein
MIINNLVVDNKLYNKRDIGMNIAAGSKSAHLNQQEALELICHLVKVFHIQGSTIEVIHLPADSNRAEVLRAAADRLDAAAKLELTPYDSTR